MDKKQKIMRMRLIWSGVFLAAGLILERAVGAATLLAALAPWVCFAASYLLAGYDVWLEALRNIRHGQVFDENLLMTVASLGAIAVGEPEEGVAVMLFYQVGELFNDYAVNRSRKSITQLMDLNPEYANLLEDGNERRLDPYDVKVGDLILIKPGERVPLDGVVEQGYSGLDQAALTGESLPVDVGEGDPVVSGSINLTGMLRVRVTKPFEDSTVSKILELVENASSRKAKMEAFITKFARVYTPVVGLLALALALVPPMVYWMLARNGAGAAIGVRAVWSVWLYRACSFLVVSCPCALVISVPLSFFGGLGAASKSGILIKGSNYLEALADLDCVVFDKTGTLTSGKFYVTDIEPAGQAGTGWMGDGYSLGGGGDKGAGDVGRPDGPKDAGTKGHLDRQGLLELAAYAESHSNHPIAKSVLAEYTGRGFVGVRSPAGGANASSSGMIDGLAQNERMHGTAGDAKTLAIRTIDPARILEVKELPGMGVSARLKWDGRERTVYAGNKRLMAEHLGDAHGEAPWACARGSAGAMPGSGAMEIVSTNGMTAAPSYWPRPKHEPMEIVSTNGKTAAAVDARAVSATEPASAPTADGTTLYLCDDDGYLGCIVLSDKLRPDVGETLAGLRENGVKRLVMLTGDKEEVAAGVGRALDLDAWYGGLLPGDKVAKVEDLLKEKPAGKTLAFVGDGINDAPVLARADVGIAMGGIGSDAAVEAADMVIMNDEPSKIIDGVRIARKTLGIVRQNI
ncbi:MAG: HAD-IC family P-type ATPase, partial [Lachnospiraceae bacterium]|nr:HAD-IC family P-type ATPase [Lachnospiraceae bacterium]